MQFLYFLALLLISPLSYADDGATLDTAANAFIIISAILVIFMSVPAIALFYGGLVRAKNMLSVLEQCLSVFVVAFLLWVIIGYTIAFSFNDGSLGSFFGSFDKFLLKNITPDSLSGVISEFTFVAFQGAFCAISACIIVGATVERVKFSALLLGIAIWVVLSYAPLAHMVWGAGFIDSTFMAYDFAGGTVVHINAAIAALVAAKIVGKRNDFGRIALPPHNLPFAYLGAGLLWIGWYGFNAGSELTADGISALAFINTIIAPAAAALSWTIAEWIFYKRPSTLGTASGVVAGLVAITPACAFVGVCGALLIGIIAGVVCLYGVHGFKRALKLDDSLDVFGIHGIGAIVGAILTGVFCDPNLGGMGFKGDYTSIAGQTYGQFMSVIISIIWSGTASFIAFGIANKLIGLRVEREDEIEGLDLASHGERAYNIN